MLNNFILRLYLCVSECCTPRPLSYNPVNQITKHIFHCKSLYFAEDCNNLLGNMNNLNRYYTVPAQLRSYVVLESSHKYQAGCTLNKLIYLVPVVTCRCRVEISQENCGQPNRSLYYTLCTAL